MGEGSHNNAPQDPQADIVAQPHHLQCPQEFEWGHCSRPTHQPMGNAPAPLGMYVCGGMLWTVMTRVIKKDALLKKITTSTTKKALGSYNEHFTFVLAAEGIYHLVYLVYSEKRKKRDLDSKQISDLALNEFRFLW